MKVLGLIVEYNPFHNGHLYHIEAAKKLTGADITVCIMSGNFIQRGEPAIINKWARTKMALISGIDLVIELPVVYSMASAEYFSFGAVKILESLGAVDYICFGSESGNVEDLETIAEVLLKEPETYGVYLQEALKKGLSYPLSREMALIKYFSAKFSNPEFIKNTLSSSNNILGIEYIKALKKLGSNIRPLTIKRANNSYNSQEITGCISSATAVRKQIYTSCDYDIESLCKSMPSGCVSILQEEFSKGRGPVFAKSYENTILGLLRKMRLEDIRDLPYVSEGLENRIKRAADKAGSWETLLDEIATKRFTRTRIQRIIFSIMTGLTKDTFETFNTFGGPQYARILGFNSKGRAFLKNIKSNCSIPLITKTSHYKASCNPLLKKMLQLEAEATDLYVLGYSNPEFKKSGQDFTSNLVIMP
ncbi:MAG: nucleotidyltransferase [Bacillota bacterium]|nr:nucleotidyltransferase [Bacillota bacterium]